MDRSPVPWEAVPAAGESRNGNLIHIKLSAYVMSSTGTPGYLSACAPIANICTANPCVVSFQQRRPSHRTSRARIWKSKTFEGNRTASCCVYVRFAEGGRYASANGRGTVETRRRLRGVVRHRCNSLLRSPINSAGRTRNPMLAALARSGRKSTARLRPPLYPAAKRLLLFRSSSIARRPRRAREPPRFIDSRRPTDCNPIPNGEI